MPRLAYTLARLYWEVLDLVFPPFCGGCDRSGSRWCPDCQAQTQVLAGTLCETCGIPIERPGLCASCKLHRPHFHQLRAWTAFHGPIRKVLHNLKYRRYKALGDTMTMQMLPFIQSLNWPVDMVIPMPLGKKRMQERGYNQSALLAWPMAQLMNWDYQPAALFRKRETRSQVKLNAEERRANVSGAFGVEKVHVQGKNILLVDDVSTTGSTLNACAQALLEGGAKQVYALTLARALPHHGLDIV